MFTSNSVVVTTMTTISGTFGSFPSADLRDLDVDDAMLNSYLFDFGKSMSATAMLDTNDPQARLNAIMATPAGDPNAVDFTIPEHEPAPQPVSQPMLSGLMSRFSPNNITNNLSNILPERLSKRNAREAVRAVAAQEETNTNPSHPSHTSPSHSEDEGGSKPARGRGRKGGRGIKDPQKIAAVQEKNRRAQRRCVVFL